ncbi:hypothetical protein H696_01091 [Fonticula alba]|uniref:Uncharacterized protein n=1 Tax=Fonticula alba TaxID=691883 RepID=A0A058ZB73_FONAL|nr:hypothetical protein H696_01091 [Fonticula alba]KCV71675.1 hypothetical protein H696_01091 [Fonticula alba]|eukprot:XP_009493253.1 hypothetical protein H696_01091 [Fonticula alba]
MADVLPLYRKVLEAVIVASRNDIGHEVPDEGTWRRLHELWSHKLDQAMINPHIVASSHDHGDDAGTGPSEAHYLHHQVPHPLNSNIPQNDGDAAIAELVLASQTGPEATTAIVPAPSRKATISLEPGKDLVTQIEDFLTEKLQQVDGDADTAADPSGGDFYDDEDSDADDSDEDFPAGSHVHTLVCLYDRVNHTKGRWRVSLNCCVMSAPGEPDSVWGRISGELKW